MPITSMSRSLAQTSSCRCGGMHSAPPKVAAPSTHKKCNYGLAACHVLSHGKVLAQQLLPNPVAGGEGGRCRLGAEKAQHVDVRSNSHTA